jgi:hypothetical protein
LHKAQDLIIYDRGYPSFQFIFEHYRRHIDFVIRAKKDFNNEIIAFYESGKNTKISDKPYNYQTYQMVRLVKVELPDGEDEILITSLLDIEKYPSKIFKNLYFQRWDVEKFYDGFKNKLKAECFSGYSKQSILQDFYVALFVSNIQSLIVGEINQELHLNTKTKYVYKVNNNLSYSLLKDRIVTLFYFDTNTEVIFSELKELFNKHLIPIRPDIKFERHKDKCRNRQKPKVPKNMKDTL